MFSSLIGNYKDAMRKDTTTSQTIEEATGNGCARRVKQKLVRDWTHDYENWSNNVVSFCFKKIRFS